ncbi:MAG: hypothetical protein KC464_23260, partial [Myxococcales bacterium]|nr:hypothetical protein [Myxococcales bacterium]
LGTFESFRTAGRDQAATDETDNLASANLYHSVSPWRVDGLGVVKLRARPRPGDVTPDPARGASRAGRLAADVADGRAVLRLEVDGDGSAALADLHLIAPLASDGRALRISLGRSGRGIRAVGYRNGIRRVVYPVSQLARRLRGR